MGTERPVTSARTAIAVMRDGVDYVLCPFFGKCDGVLVIEPTKSTAEFVPNPKRDAESLSGLVAGSNAKRLICGYIPDTERERLSASGVDIRLGSCADAVDELLVAFPDLPHA